MSHSLRRSLIFACLAALVAIAGMMAYVIGFGIFAPGEEIARSVASPTLSESNIAPIDAGLTPNVTIDDPDTHVVIAPSTDGKIHVNDVYDTHGWVVGGRKHMTISASGPDVHIARPRTQNGMSFIIGSMHAQLAIALPAAARVTVTDAGGLDVNGIEGDVTAHAGDGNIHVTGTKGVLDIKAGGGRIYLTGVHAPRIIAHSYSGRLVFNEVTTEQLDADTRDGRILVDGLRIAGANPRAVLSTGNGPVLVTATLPSTGTYTLRSADGSIRLRLPPTSNVSIVASTNSGKVDADAAFAISGDAMHKTAKLGNGGASVTVSSADGSIHLETTGAL